MSLVKTDGTLRDVCRRLEGLVTKHTGIVKNMTLLGVPCHMENVKQLRKRNVPCAEAIVATEDIKSFKSEMSTWILSEYLQNNFKSQQERIAVLQDLEKSEPENVPALKAIMETKNPETDSIWDLLAYPFRLLKKRKELRRKREIKDSGWLEVLEVYHEVCVADHKNHSLKVHFRIDNGNIIFMRAEMASIPLDGLTDSVRTLQQLITTNVPPESVPTLVESIHRFHRATRRLDGALLACSPTTPIGVNADQDREAIKEAAGYFQTLINAYLKYPANVRCPAVIVYGLQFTPTIFVQDEPILQICLNRDNAEHLVNRIRKEVPKVLRPKSDRSRTLLFVTTVILLFTSFLLKRARISPLLFAGALFGFVLLVALAEIDGLIDTPPDIHQLLVSVYPILTSLGIEHIEGRAREHIDITNARYSAGLQDIATKLSHALQGGNVALITLEGSDTQGYDITGVLDAETKN